MPPDQTRHTVLLEGRDLGIIERALRALAQIRSIQAEGTVWVSTMATEAQQIARTSSRVQLHAHCDCNVASGGEVPNSMSEIPVDERTTVKEVP